MSSILLKPNQLLQRPDYANIVLEWKSDAEREEYEHNKKKVDPYYHKNPIVYKHNCMGYRSKEIGCTDGDFLLAMGCSITEGLALHEEDIWCTRLAEDLDLDLINLGLSGAGMPAVLLNTMRYIDNGYQYPKIVVIQHPERARMLHAQFVTDDGEQRLHLETSPLYDRRKEELDWLDNNITAFVHSGIYTDLITKLWNSVGVPVLHWTMNGDGEDFLSKYFVLEFPHDLDPSDDLVFDLARDLSHAGRAVHKRITAGLLPHAQALLESDSLNMPAQLNRKRDLDKRSAYKHFIKKAIQIHKQEKPNE